VYYDTKLPNLTRSKQHLTKGAFSSRYREIVDHIVSDENSLGSYAGIMFSATMKQANTGNIDRNPSTKMFFAESTNF